MEEDLRAAAASQRRRPTPTSSIVNTCSVTATADQGARQTIRRIARDNPASASSSPAAMRDPLRERIAALPDVVARRRATADKDSDSSDLRRVTAADVDWLGSGDGPVGRRSSRASPDARRSRCGCRPAATSPAPTASSRRREARAKRAGGTTSWRTVERAWPRPDSRRSTLTGVHLGSYGRDLRRRGLADRFAARARSRARRTSCFASARSSRWTARRRSSSSWRPAAGDSPRTSICRCSTRAIDMLTAMRRPYTLADYRRLVDAIAERLPHASIGSDMIVGFPGETDDDFRREPRLSAGLSADAPARVSLL